MPSLAIHNPFFYTEPSNVKNQVYYPKLIKNFYVHDQRSRHSFLKFTDNPRFVFTEYHMLLIFNPLTNISCIFPKSKFRNFKVENPHKKHDLLLYTYQKEIKNKSKI
jgi:hypothetical protein